LSGKLDLKLGGDYPLAANSRWNKSTSIPSLRPRCTSPGDRPQAWSTGISALADSERARKRWAVEAKLCRISLSTTENVKLKMSAPLRLNLSQDEVRVEQSEPARTDRISRAGSARFAGDRALSLRVDGAVSLQFLGVSCRVSKQLAARR